jgi:hypothetical protein
MGVPFGLVVIERAKRYLPYKSKTKIKVILLNNSQNPLLKYASRL